MISDMPAVDYHRHVIMMFSDALRSTLEAKPFDTDQSFITVLYQNRDKREGLDLHLPYVDETAIPSTPL